MSDPFAPSNGAKEQKHVSPSSKLPYYVPASQSSMRDKLPRINVPPWFFTGMNHVIALGKIPEFKDVSAIIRYFITVGMKSLDEDLSDPDFAKYYSMWVTLSELDLIQNKIDAFRNIMDRIDNIARDRDSSPGVIESLKTSVRRAVDEESDPYYKAQLELAFERLR